MANLKECLALLLITFLVVSALPRTRRSEEETTKAPATEICYKRQPCGWAVYNSISRYIDYFMKNKCECGTNKKCVRDEDDISITAYVYRCKIYDNTETS